MRRPHGRVEIDPYNPKAAAVCDRCGGWWNHHVLRFRYQWQGTKLMNTGFLECPDCWCPPDNHARTFRIQADPLPIRNPRPMNYDAAETDYRALTTGDLRVLETGEYRVIDDDTGGS